MTREEKRLLTNKAATMHKGILRGRDATICGVLCQL